MIRNHEEGSAVLHKRMRSFGILFGVLVYSYEPVTAVLLTALVTKYLDSL